MEAWAKLATVIAIVIAVFTCDAKSQDARFDIGSYVETKGLTFLWDAVEEPGVSGYKLYWFNSPDYPADKVGLNVIDTGKETTGDITFTWGKWWVAATAYDTFGLESDYSEKLEVWIVPPPPSAPGPLQVTQITVLFSPDMIEWEPVVVVQKELPVKGFLRTEAKPKRALRILEIE